MLCQTHKPLWIPGHGYREYRRIACTEKQPINRPVTNPGFFITTIVCYFPCFGFMSLSLKSDWLVKIWLFWFFFFFFFFFFFSIGGEKEGTVWSRGSKISTWLFCVRACSWLLVVVCVCVCGGGGGVYWKLGPNNILHIGSKVKTTFSSLFWNKPPIPHANCYGHVPFDMFHHIRPQNDTLGFLGENIWVSSIGRCATLGYTAVTLLTLCRIGSVSDPSIPGLVTIVLNTYFIDMMMSWLWFYWLPGFVWSVRKSID